MVYGPFIRSVGYHSVQPEEAENFERHIEWYSKNFVNVGSEQLEAFLAGKPWEFDRPGILLSFDDGTRTHFETVAPILEKYAFTGWFFVPSGLLNLGEDDPDDEFSRDGTRARNLTVGQLQSLSQRHVVGGHGSTHIRLGSEVDGEVLRREICDSKAVLQDLIGTGVNAFCWIGGEEWAFCREASDLVRENYRYAFMGNSDVILPASDPFQLSRSNVEAYNPMSLVRFQLSGLVDLYFSPRRRRIQQTTAPNDRGLQTGGLGFSR
jgi:peptidoglycan/xylan/chitin deacetylase (PgdA/CDA1 family)